MSVFKREFPHPNMSNNWKCPICDTGADRPVVLMPIPGTEDDGICQAKQIHSDCLENGVAHILREA